MQEYYIRNEGDEDSRGPFTVDQLSSLVEAGQVDRVTLYYDANAEKWVEIQSNSELTGTLFPVKKKLTVRKKETVESLNASPEPNEKGIQVEDLLAAADGRTEETRGKRDRTQDEAVAAMWGMRAMGLILLVSAAGMMVSNMGILETLEFFPIVTSPLIILGLVDLVLALLLFLEVTAIYNLVRIRAAIGLGFFLVYFGSIGDWIPFAAVAAGSLALFALTRIYTLGKVIFVGILGLAGMGWFAYTMLY